jgi:hypothetical protein
MIEIHVGRSFGDRGGPLEAACACRKAPCGLVLAMEADEECPEHSPFAGATIRSLHNAEACPGPEA